jgi:YVTN family beta-propeller protein
VPKTGLIVATIENPDGLLLIDPIARKVVRKYDVKGKSPHMVALSPDGAIAYVSNSNSNAVAALNLASGNVEKIIPVGKNPQGGTVTRDGKRLYISNDGSNTISIIDTTSNQVIGEIKTGDEPARAEFTPDEKLLVYNLQSGEGCGFADPRTGKQIAQVKLPGKPLSLSLSRDGLTAYLGLMDSDSVAIVSVAGKKVIRIVPTPKGAGPDTVTPLF